ncbi:hypothetical protein ACQCP0_23045 [Ralstonia pseudosolanacearum]|uniref:hypothetical protein n=3 Tax=Ralstonia pseudosolanacearum TaxID=1310165 RepID=UPI0007EA6003|nr:hypothetical protein [Ralstonia pseudosolanacearum]ANH33837.1 hypothetical protein A3768_2700 [Ralstonia solanacearum]AXV68825.1 hypothetical protein CJO74_05705 [Ralstonia solanacearum]AXV96536.1 hypothetical protein CJO80_13775 [Ralstonia solanacearum]AXW11218.1 hypothetical protein CJO83_12595 [Ralstonia solanacearum]AXW43788.1 hypothetical protein CJO90_12600 [Ralstonia solanacearum]
MPNLWRQFEDLLPDAPLLVGTVVTSHDDGTVTVQLLGGGLVRVTGAGEPGERLFVRGAEVIGSAPTLPTVEIEI